MATAASLLRLENGKGRMRKAFATLKMAVLAPIPRASVRTAMAVKPGFLNSIRTPNLRSWNTPRNIDLHPQRQVRRNGDSSSNGRATPLENIRIEEQVFGLSIYLYLIVLKGFNRSRVTGKWR